VRQAIPPTAPMTLAGKIRTASEAAQRTRRMPGPLQAMRGSAPQAPTTPRCGSRDRGLFLAPEEHLRRASPCAASNRDLETADGSRPTTGGQQDDSALERSVADHSQPSNSGTDDRGPRRDPIAQRNSAPRGLVVPAVRNLRDASDASPIPSSRLPHEMRDPMPAAMQTRARAPLRGSRPPIPAAPISREPTADRCRGAG